MFRDISARPRKYISEITLSTYFPIMLENCDMSESLGKCLLERILLRIERDSNDNRDSSEKLYILVGPY